MTASLPPLSAHPLMGPLARLSFVFLPSVSFLFFLSQKNQDHRLKSSPVLFLSTALAIPMCVSRLIGL
jgi:hypothetical protein